jgi:hypothetical protein
MLSEAKHLDPSIMARNAISDLINILQRPLQSRKSKWIARFDDLFITAARREPLLTGQHIIRGSAVTWSDIT